MEKIKKKPLISLALLPFTKDRHEGKPARQKKGPQGSCILGKELRLIYLLSRIGGGRVIHSNL